MRKKLFALTAGMLLSLMHYAAAQDFTTLSRFFFDPSRPAEAVPYVSATLEPEKLPSDPIANVEELVIRLDAVDCTTLVEYVSAAVLARESEPLPGDSLFCHYLQLLRYRNGERGNYATRKHYFSEWISDAESHGLLSDVTATLAGAVPLKRPVNFMSRNVKYYPQLQSCRLLLSEIMKAERMLSEQTFYYIPSSQLQQVYKQLKHGDIVAFVTEKAGLDIQHVGFVWYPDPSAHAPQLYHASTTQKAVTIDPTTLQDYATSVKNCIGVRIVRLKNDR